MKTKYSMKITWSDEDKMFVATCPELYDVCALSVTHEGAVKELQIVIGLVLDSYKEDGITAPPPSFLTSSQ